MTNRVNQVTKDQLLAACLKHQGKGCIALIKQELNVTSLVLGRLCTLYEIEPVRHIVTTQLEITRKYVQRVVDRTGYTPQVLRYQKDPRTRLIASAKNRSRHSGLEFDLHPSDIVIPSVCPVLGIPISLNTGGKTHSNNSPSLDRVDNTRGYVWNNVIVVSWRANRIKVDAEVEELEKVAAFYRNCKPLETRNEVVRSRKRTDRRLTKDQEKELADRYIPRGKAFKGSKSNVKELAEEYGISVPYCQILIKKNRK